jgi:hypothetical protein
MGRVLVSALPTGESIYIEVRTHLNLHMVLLLRTVHFDFLFMAGTDILSP